MRPIAVVSTGSVEPILTFIVITAQLSSMPTITGPKITPDRNRNRLVDVVPQSRQGIAYFGDRADAAKPREPDTNGGRTDLVVAAGRILRDKFRVSQAGQITVNLGARQSGDLGNILQG